MPFELMQQLSGARYASVILPALCDFLDIRGLSYQLRMLMSWQTEAKPAAPQMVDVGCGIGGSSRHIARRLGCAARGITLSPVQVSSPTCNLQSQICQKADFSSQ